MPGESVDELREQLRARGYLSHGIERWFALDPWRSRTFWFELAVVASKAAVLVALFAAIADVALMVVRNHPLSALETFELTLLYAAAWFAAAAIAVSATGLLLKLRPSLGVDTPRALLAISLALAALLVVPQAVWWSRFETAPALPELAVGLALFAIFFVITTIVTSAALLTFSVYELQRVPAIHQKPRSVPMTLAAAAMIAFLFIPAYAAREKRTAETPIQVVTTPTSRRVAFVAVDGLTLEIFRSRPSLAAAFATVSDAAPLAGNSTTERWATVGTGVPPSIHGVRSIEGVRLRGGDHLLQSISRADVVLLDLAEALGIATRQPLPPAVRRRDYIWEIVAARGVRAVAVNWWTTTTSHTGALDCIGQESVFAGAGGDPIAIDATAVHALLDSVDRQSPRFATVYLPALDVVLNRIPLDTSARVAASLRALDSTTALVAALRQRGFDVVLTGLPGDTQNGRAVIASTLPLPPHSGPIDLAPELLSLLGFPASREMPGRTTVNEPRIASYGPRASSTASPRVDREYYDNLRSLGYIR